MPRKYKMKSTRAPRAWTDELVAKAKEVYERDTTASVDEIIAGMGMPNVNRHTIYNLRKARKLGPKTLKESWWKHKVEGTKPPPAPPPPPRDSIWTRNDFELENKLRVLVRTTLKSAAVIAAELSTPELTVTASMVISKTKRLGIQRGAKFKPAEQKSYTRANSVPAKVTPPARPAKSKFDGSISFNRSKQVVLSKREMQEQLRQAVLNTGGVAIDDD